MCCFTAYGKPAAHVKMNGMFESKKPEAVKPLPDAELTIQIVPHVYSNGYNISCFGAKDGIINLNVSGGEAPYYFLWSTGDTTQNISGQPVGYYRVTVIDANLNTVTGDVTLTQPNRVPKLMADGDAYKYPNGYNVSCISCFNGSINIDVSGGTGSYLYEWKDGPTTQDRNGLGAGSYSVLIIDNGTCSNGENIRLYFELREPPVTNWEMSGNYGTNPGTHFIGTKDNTDFVFRTNNIERLRLKSSGNIGIGTINPTEKLTVSGSGIFTENLTIGKSVIIRDSLKIDSLGGPGFNFDSLSNKSYKLVYVDQDGKFITNLEYNYIENPLRPCLTENTIPWTIGGNTLPLNNEDYNFIGTCTPSPFRIYTDASERMRITTDGNVGIGTISPRQKLEVRNGSILVSGENSGIFFQQSFVGYTPPNQAGDHGNYGIEYLPPDVNNNNKGGLNFWRPFGNEFDGQVENFVLHLTNDGHVGIGTGNPEYRLDVCGIIRSNIEIVVNQNGWCDFVFEPDFYLESFEKRMSTIKAQRHLPYILPEAEIANSGVPVSETMRGILQNVEELYLYMEIMEQRIKQLEEENIELKRKLIY